MGWRATSRRGNAIWYVRGRNGRPEQLPRHAAPDLWRPEHPASWPDPLPEPATLQPEPDPPLLPPHLRRRQPRLLKFGELPLPWQIAYAPPGRISIEDCEARLLRALKTDRALPNRERAQMAVKVYALETEPAPGDWTNGVQLRWAPFPADTEDHLVAMGWFARLTPRERAYLRERSLGWSFVRMGDERGRSDEWARQQYIEALTKAWCFSNLLGASDSRSASRPDAPGQIDGAMND